MKFRVLVCLFCFCTLFASGFSYVNVSSCQDIDAALLAGETEVRMNESVSTNAGACFTFSQGNIVFDCQNNVISATNINVDAFYIDSVNDVSIKNCIITNVTNAFYIRLTMNHNVTDIKISNSTRGLFFMANPSNSYYRNIQMINLSNSCIYAYNTDNNIFDNIDCINSNSGLTLRGHADGNIIRNSDFRGCNGYSIYFDDQGGTDRPTSNILYNNHLGNSSLIINDIGNWAFFPGNSFNYSGIGNYYDDMDIFAFGDCFDAGGLFCDYFRQLEGAGGSGSGGTSSVFPFGNFVLMFVFVLIGILFV